MKNVFLLCALTACVSATAQDFSIYFSESSEALLMQANRLDDVETFTETLDGERMDVAVAGALRRLTETLKTDEAARRLAETDRGLTISFLGESARISLDPYADYFAWRIAFSNEQNDYIAARYYTAVEAIRSWAARMFSGEI